VAVPVDIELVASAMILFFLHDREYNCGCDGEEGEQSRRRELETTTRPTRRVAATRREPGVYRLHTLQEARKKSFVLRHMRLAREERIAGARLKDPQFSLSIGACGFSPNSSSLVSVACSRDHCA
jgi:hypothetical protein